jgi:hypothetical protein
MVERELPHPGVLRLAGRRCQRRLDVTAVVAALDEEVTVLLETLLERSRRDREIHPDPEAPEDVLVAIHLGRAIAAPQHHGRELASRAVPVLDPARARAARERDERREHVAARLRELIGEQRTGRDADARDALVVGRELGLHAGEHVVEEFELLVHAAL